MFLALVLLSAAPAHESSSSNRQDHRQSHWSGTREVNHRPVILLTVGGVAPMSPRVRFIPPASASSELSISA
jgi:hypothetical protein